MSCGFGGVTDSTNGTVGISEFRSCATLSTGLEVLCSVVTIAYLTLKSLPKGVISLDELDGHPQI